ncbi:hypothetical protein BHM03_00054185 [Ensete ventricosum]|nr:hypothetical protein BHM03_00054185 [Ensete ventricosum]
MPPPLQPPSSNTRGGAPATPVVVASSSIYRSFPSSLQSPVPSIYPSPNTTIGLKFSLNLPSKPRFDWIKAQDLDISAPILAKWVFYVCASKLASDESLGHQHMGSVYHRGRSQIVSTSESHRGDLIIQMYDRSGWRVELLQCSHSLKGARQVRGQSRLPKSEASVRKGVDSKEHHSVIEADLLIAKE